MTVAVPEEPRITPMKPDVLDTLPPASMFSVPVPEKPTNRSPVLVQVEPAPVTVAVPVEPAPWPIEPNDAVVVPPVRLNAPRPVSAIYRNPERLSVPLSWL